jgi:3-phenylpropionate/cinnamic acid dioxygenase small subunit
MTAAMPSGDALLAAASAFVIHEARLLDTQQWQAWDDLFTPDGLYWVPAAPGQTDHKLHISLMLDNALLRQVRIKRFDSTDASSLQPFPRSVHFVTNIAAAATGPDRCTVTSAVLMVQSQRDDQHIYAGLATHDLHWIDGGFRIALKRVDLVNCDAALPSIHLYI